MKGDYCSACRLPAAAAEWNCKPMEVICKPVGMNQANCYIVTDQQKALVIDPGDEASLLEALINALNVKVQGIVLTHAHFDHIGAVDALIEKFGTDVYVNKAEFDFLQNSRANGSSVFGLPPVTLKAQPKELKEGEQKIGDFTIDAYYAPGHSAGSTILAIGDNLFTGDVLFQNSIGRTDLPSGDAQQMKDSLNFLKSLTKNYTVYPGHGPSTTLDYEKTHNPYLLYNLLG